MKFWILASVALAEEVPGLNGWRVTCRVPIEKPGFALIDDGALYQGGRILQEIYVILFTEIYNSKCCKIIAKASYGLGSTDSIYRIRDFNGTPQGCIQNFDRLEKIIDKGIPWPNEIARVPDRIMHDGHKWYTVRVIFYFASRMKTYYDVKLTHN